jgi:hypothetical protein
VPQGTPFLSAFAAADSGPLRRTTRRSSPATSASEGGLHAFSGPICRVCDELKPPTPVDRSFSPDSLQLIPPSLYCFRYFGLHFRVLFRLCCRDLSIADCGSSGMRIEQSIRNPQSESEIETPHVNRGGEI